MGDPAQALADDVLGVLRSAVFAIGVDGRVEHANPAAERLLGHPLAELVGSDLHDLVHRHSGGCSLGRSLAGAAAAEEESDVFRRADGTTVPVSWTADPLGTGRSVVAVLDATRRDLDRAALWAAQQSVSDLGWIAELTRAMSSTMDEDEALRRLVRLMTPRLADVALVDSLDALGELRRVGGSVAPGVDLALELLLDRDDVAHVAGLAGDATRRIVARPTVTRMSAEQMADPGLVSEPSRVLLGEIGARSMLVVPLAARNRTVGVAALIRLTDDAFSDDELVLAADIGRRAGLVLDNARLYHEQERAAEDLQRALLPVVHDVGPLEVAARYLPATDRLQIGGDWYDLFTCPGDDDAKILVIGDVAGHDLPAATSMAAVRNLLRGIAVSESGGPATVLAAVDNALPALDIAGTATCLVMRVQPDDGRWRLTWSTAGHPPAVVIEPGGVAEVLDGLIDPLLGTRSAATHRENVRHVATGSVILLYTDGLIERRTEDIDRGIARLRLAASDLAPHLTMHEVIGAVLDRMAAAHEDDTAVLAVRLG